MISRLPHQSYHSIVQSFAYQPVMSLWPNKFWKLRQRGTPFQRQNSAKNNDKKYDTNENKNVCKQITSSLSLFFTLLRSKMFFFVYVSCFVPVRYQWYFQRLAFDPNISLLINQRPNGRQLRQKNAHLPQ